jgi:protein ImuA
VAEDKNHIISALRNEILRMEGFRSECVLSAPHLSGPIQDAFPGSVFPLACTHEFLVSEAENFAATGAFISALVSSWLHSNGAVVWIGAEQKLLPTALEPFGISPSRFIFVTAREKDILWVTEEALKCPAVAAVISEVRDMGFTASRRLQLAVEQSRTTGFIIRHMRSSPGTTACVSRWRIAQLPSDPIDTLPGLGFPKWRVDLLRVRNGRPGSWDVQWAEGKLEYLVEKESVEIKQAHAG